MAHILKGFNINRLFEQKQSVESKWLNCYEMAILGRNDENMLSDSQIIVKFYSEKKVVDKKIYHMWSGCLLKSEFFRHYLESVKHGFTENLSDYQEEKNSSQSRSHANHKKISFLISTDKDKMVGFETFLDLVTRFVTEDEFHLFIHNDHKNIKDKQLMKKTFENCEIVKYFSTLYAFPIVYFLCCLISNILQKLIPNNIGYPKNDFFVSNIVKLNLTEIQEIKRDNTDIVPLYITRTNSYRFVDFSILDQQNSSKTDFVKKYLPDFRFVSSTDVNSHNFTECSFCSFTCQKKIPNNYGLTRTEDSNVSSIIDEFDQNVTKSLYNLNGLQSLSESLDSCSFFVHKYQNKINSNENEKWNLVISHNMPTFFKKVDDFTKITGPYIKIGNFSLNGLIFNLSLITSTKIISKRDGKVIVCIVPYIIINTIPNTKKFDLNGYPSTNYFKKILTHDIVSMDQSEMFDNQVLFTNVPTKNYDVFYPFKKDVDPNLVCFKNFDHEETKCYSKNDREYKDLFETEKIESPIVDFSEYSLINKINNDKMFFGTTIISEKFGISTSKRVFLNLTKISELTQNKKEVIISLPDIKISLNQKFKTDNNIVEINDSHGCSKSHLMKSIIESINEDQIRLIDDDVLMTSSDEDQKYSSQKNKSMSIDLSDEDDDQLTFCDGDCETAQNIQQLTVDKIRDTILTTFTFGWISKKKTM